LAFSKDQALQRKHWLGAFRAPTDPTDPADPAAAAQSHQRDNNEKTAAESQSQTPPFDSANSVFSHPNSHSPLPPSSPPPALSYKAFVDSVLILFSFAHNVRAIPTLLDGLKPTQRKILYSCLRRPRNDEAKVAQLAGSDRSPCAPTHAGLHTFSISILHAEICGLSRASECQ
jgi:hypothetical protein